jgi:hypothetical protein
MNEEDIQQVLDILETTAGQIADLLNISSAMLASFLLLTLLVSLLLNLILLFRRQRTELVKVRRELSIANNRIKDLENQEKRAKQRGDDLEKQRDTERQRNASKQQQLQEQLDAARQELKQLKQMFGQVKSIDALDQKLREQGTSVLKHLSAKEQQSYLEKIRWHLELFEQNLREQADHVQSMFLDKLLQEQQQQDLQRSVSNLERRIATLQAQEQVISDRLCALVHADSLLCDQCWLSWPPDEVLYIPDTHKPVIKLLVDNLSDDQQVQAEGEGLLKDQALALVQRTEWQTHILRNFPHLDTSEKQLAGLFMLRCPNHQKHERMGDGRLLPAAHNWFVPIIGGTSSGKTVYMTTLIHTLEYVLLTYGHIIQPYDDDATSEENYIYMRQQLFHDGIIRPTQGGEQFDMIFQICSQQDIQGKRITLFFKDLPGESWQMLSAQDTQEAEFLRSARAIMFMFDPMADPYLKNMIVRRHPAILHDERSHLNQVSILRRLGVFLQRVGMYGDRIPKHLLIVLTKADLLKGLVFQDNHPIYQPYMHAPPYPLKKTALLSQDIKTRLSKIHGLPHLIQLLDAQFESVTYFAVSALGHPPLDRTTDGFDKVDVENLKPHRVEDPVLYAMHLAGLLGPGHDQKG